MPVSVAGIEGQVVGVDLGEYTAPLLFENVGDGDNAYVYASMSSASSFQLQYPSSSDGILTIAGPIAVGNVPSVKVLGRFDVLEYIPGDPAPEWTLSLIINVNLSSPEYESNAVYTNAAFGWSSPVSLSDFDEFSAMV